MCLRSGLASCMPWALNTLALASFQTRPELLLPGLPGLLPALLQVCSVFKSLSLWSDLTPKGLHTSNTGNAGHPEIARVTGRDPQLHQVHSMSNAVA